MQQGACTWTYVGPSVFMAFSTFCMKSAGYAIEAVATYGEPWAARIRGMSFFGRRLPIEAFPAGLVVVEASNGVAPERWIPVFM